MGVVGGRAVEFFCLRERGKDIPAVSRRRTVGSVSERSWVPGGRRSGKERGEEERGVHSRVTHSPALSNGPKTPFIPRCI